MALISDVVAGATIDPSWGNAIRNATVQVTTSGARPASPTEGMVIYETDTDLLLAYTGTTWVQIGTTKSTQTFGAWTSFTATLKQTTTPAQTSNYAKFSRVGNTIVGNVRITLSGTGTSGDAITVTTSGLPAPSTQLAVGPWSYSRIGTGLYVGTVELSTTPTFIFYSAYYGGVPTTQFGATPSFQAGGGGSDVMKFSFTYEAA